MRLPIYIHLLFALAAAFYVVQPWAPKIAGVPSQVILVWLCLGLLITTRFKVFKSIGLNFSALQWVCIAIMLTAVLYRTLMDGDGYLRLQQVLTGIVLSIVAATVAADYKRRKWLLYAMLLSASVSGFIALLQFIGKAGWTWNRTLYFGFSQKVPSGLETYPVAYSYSVLGILVVCGSIGLYQILNGKRNQINFISPAVGLPAVILILMGLFVSGSRSGILGVISGGLVVWAFFKFTRIRYIPLVYLLPVVFIIPLMYSLTDWAVFDFFKEKISKVESDARVEGAWRLFMPVIFEYPLGIPAEIYEQRDSYAGDALNQVYRGNAGYDPHNIFLTVAIFYGFFGAFGLLSFYVVTIFQGYLGLKRYGKNAVREDVILLVLAIGAIIALFVHSWFHNASILLGEMRGWIWFGFAQGLLGNVRRAAIQ